MSRRAALWGIAVAVALSSLPASAWAFQTPAPVRLIAFRNEPSEPEFGEVFELYLSLRIAPGVVAFVPDTLLPDEHAFSAGAGTWSSAAGPADSVDVEATYPVMGLLTGGIQLPWIEILSRRATPGEVAGARPSREVDALGDSARATLDRTVVEIGGAMIQVPKEMQGEEASIDPHPPADVIGGDWSPWVLAGFGVALVAMLTLIGMVVAARRAAVDPGRATANPREEALRELDRVRGLGWHDNGRMPEFYDATTAVLRRLSETEEPEWQRALTSTELLGRMQERWGAGRVERLRPAVWSAERAKFGSFRPAPEAAEADWTTVRDWIRELPES